MTTGLRSFDGRGLAKATIIRRFSMDTHMVRIYTGSLSQEFDFVSVEADKVTTAEEVIRVAVTKLDLPIVKDYELAEVYNTAGQLCKERRLDNTENPVRVQLLWPRCTNPDLEQPNSLHTGYRFYIRKKISENTNKMVGWFEQPADTLLTDFLTKSLNKEYSDLCNLPDLNERTLLENIKQRFQQQDTGIYTYVGSILIAVNPFQFFPIYNPKYVKMYQNKRLGDLPPHIFAIADAAFHTMLRTKRNQCIVISGESGSGKTESTNLLLHHLTALSHKGLHGSGVEQTILGAGPVLEAFGNAKTVHNNNSSRFGKFIQVNYKENGMVHGAIVEKYLLEKSRIVSQARNERNYHVFYYLLAGADPLEREKLHLGKPEDYHYLNQSDCYNIDDVDEAGEFSRLKQSMEMVGFSQVTQKRIFGVLSAVLHLGNVKFKKKGDQHHDESVTVLNQDTIAIISNLLKVKEKTLVEALTQKRATAGDETVVMTHRMEDALATRDAMAKCLYGALFDWIVLKVNQALLAKRHNSEHQGNSIGVLDIFGFEDFSKNSFEQFCINYANEHLQYYFNQHIFKFEQEEYKKEGIQWKNIEFIDNTGCLELFSRKSKGLFPLLDEECNFPGATNETLLSKFHHHHSKGNVYYEAPQKRELVFTVVHYAGKVKYQIKDFREKNSDQIRTDIVANMKSSSLAFVRELMGVDPVAVLRWTILKTLIKSMFAFIQAGKRYRARGGPDPAVVQRRKQSTDRYLTIPDLNGSHIPRKNKSFKPRSRPQTMFSDIKTLKAIATRTMYTGGKVGSKQKSPSVGAQFQWSLSRLMSTLNQANPFFIRCIKSNAEKEPCKFDDVLVLRQLRYTGMLATVRIRQSGYNYRLTFEEFAQLYKILLPKGLQSDKEDIQEFLDSTPMNNDNYQIGITKVFLRETEKLYLDECLHRAIMKRVIAIQRWVKTKVERKNFVVLRENAVLIQRYVRSFLARRRLMLVKASVLMIQRWYRMMKVQREFQNVRCNTICIQAHIRGHLTRKKYKQQKMEYELLQAEREALKHSDDMLSSASDEGVLLKDSADELENLKFIRRDSEESSGIPDDSESDTLSDAKSRGDSMTTPPPTPTSIGMPGIVVEGLGAATKDPFILQSGKLASRVPDLAKRFQTSPESPMDETDSRTVQGSIFIPRGAGRKRPPKMSPAPLAKQESFSDLESPTAEKGHQLTPERLKDMEDKLKLSRTLMPTDNLTASTEDMYSRSPLKRAVNYLTTSGGRKKKDSAADDSDDEMETGKDHHAKRPKDIGVRVFPAGPLSPKSPKEETSSLTSFDEQDEKGKRIKKKRQTVRATDKDKENKPMETYFSVSKASQWQYPEEFIITDVHELQLLDEFIGRKINDLNKDKQKKEIDKDAGTDKKMPGFDVVLTMCLEAFQMELKTTLSVALQKGTCNTKYRDLFANFEVTMKATCVSQKLNSDFPVTMCINAFRGFLDEFRNLVKKKDNKTKKRKVKHREKAKKDIIEHLGHKFSQVQFGIPTFCELCSNIIWLMEKGHVCQVCRYTCHRKCYSKSTTPCKGVQDPSEQRLSGTKVFGVPLNNLVGKEDKMPEFMENLIGLIETHGLFTVGIYRICGNAHKIKTLKMYLDSGHKDININEYAIHVLTATLKSFLRELPEPLLTFELYDEFMQASEIQDEKEAIQVLFSITERLPKLNHDVFERIIFHLARVANHEASNKMSANGLAIIFAPCLLRTNKVIKVQDMISHVNKQQICIEKILQEQLKKLRTTLEDISTLESAEVTANERLTVVRASMRTNREQGKASKQDIPPSVSEDPEALEEQERVISSHIKSLRKEKDELTSGLPSFEYRHSSDDEMLSVDDMESQYETADEDGREESGSSFDIPGCVKN